MTNADQISHAHTTIATDRRADRQWFATGGLVVGVSTTAIALALGLVPVLPLIIVGLSAAVRANTDARA